MTEEKLLRFIDEKMRSRPRYVLDQYDCEAYIREIFSLDGIEFDKNLLAAKDDFVLVKDNLSDPARLQIMDVVVFRGTKGRRHVGVMIDHRWFTDFSQELGVMKTEITRNLPASEFIHAGRHKKYANHSR